MASADLKLQGTYDRPAIFGRAEVDRGSIVFEGNRYVVTRGTIDFLTPPAGNIEPLFDIEAETRVRVPSQTYRVTLGVTGTPRSFSLALGSDPPLPEVDIIALLFGTTTDVSNAELRALSPTGATEAEEALLRAAGARLLAGSISAPVRRVVEETLRLDTAQITPTIGTENDPLTPSARLILGKRLSPRAYLTFSRALGIARARSDHRARIRPERPRRLRAHADRRPDVRGRLPRAPQLLMRLCGCSLRARRRVAAAAGFAQADCRDLFRPSGHRGAASLDRRRADHRCRRSSS